MSHDLTQLKNLGPKTTQWLHDAGIHTAEDLFQVGAVEAYFRVKAIHPKLSLNGLYAFQAAILDIHWTDLPPDMKEDLKRQVGRM